MLCILSSQLVIVLCCVRLCMLHFLFGSVYVCVNLKMDSHLQPFIIDVLKVKPRTKH